ncbi:glutaredoxin [Bacillus sp. OTU530]|uniref:glutaredoxin n=1 Tax=Bacillus sp. OTU530 TaxID=3043862 RepID=UPI00313ABC6B
MAKKIEVFTAGSYLCDGVVEQVKQLACPKCEVVVYDLNKNNSTTEWEQKSKAYGIQSIPSVAMDGKIIDLTKLKKQDEINC